MSVNTHEGNKSYQKKTLLRTAVSTNQAPWTRVFALAKLFRYYKATLLYILFAWFRRRAYHLHITGPLILDRDTYYPTPGYMFVVKKGVLYAILSKTGPDFSICPETEAAFLNGGCFWLLMIMIIVGMNGTDSCMHESSPIEPRVRGTKLVRYYQAKRNLRQYCCVPDNASNPTCVAYCNNSESPFYRVSGLDSICLKHLFVVV